MDSIERWHFQWPWRTPNPVFKVTEFLKSNISKTVYFRDKVKNTNRKPHTIYRMMPLSMTLSDLWPRFQGHGVTEGECLKKWCVLGTKFLQNTRRKPYVNASCGFVSISWACTIYFHCSACSVLELYATSTIMWVMS